MSFVTDSDPLLVAENVRLAGEVRRLRIENAKLVTALDEIDRCCEASERFLPSTIMENIRSKVGEVFTYLIRKDDS